MKKLIVCFVITLSVTILSCGGKKVKTSDQIVVSELKDACDCLDAMDITATEMLAALNKYGSSDAMRKDEKGLETINKLDSKMAEINQRCIVELNIPKGEAKKCPGFDKVEAKMREAKDKLE